jgi:putative DNA primase/helicase
MIKSKNAPYSSQIPAELVERYQWLPHRNKVPIDPATVDKASYTDPTVPVPFLEAITYAQQHNLDGVGFVASADDPLACIDMDNVRNPDTGDIDPDVLDQIDQFDSYTELSPSGRGLHIWLIGTKPGPG